MIKVNEKNLGNCKNILYDDIPSFSGIVVKESRGDVWVNDLEYPTLAVVYSEPVGGYAILGNVNSEAAYVLLTEFMDRLVLKTSDCFEFSIEEETLEKRLLSHFSSKPLQKEYEYFHRIDHSVPEIPFDDYDIQEIDLGIINQLKGGHYTNGVFLKDMLLESWSNYDDFIDRSIGYIAVDGPKIIGFIVGSSRYHDILPINIEVLKDYRKKGIAAKLSQVFVDSCLSKNLIPQWNCVETNSASIKTAEKIGFKRFKKKYYYYFKVNEVL